MFVLGEIQWMILILVVGGKDYITPQVYKQYILTLGDFLLPTTFHKNGKFPLRNWHRQQMQKHMALADRTRHMLAYTSLRLGWLFLRVRGKSHRFYEEQLGRKHQF